MLPRNHPDRIRIAFDDHRLVANAGLILPATLAPAPRLAPTGPESPGLGRCTGPGQHRRQGDDPGGLRPGRRRLHRRRRCVAHRRDGPRSRLRSQSAIYPGDLRWGHARQLDRVSRQLLARAWAVGAGPGDAPLTIDLDSTICETCGLAKGGARHHGYTGARGYHPLLAIAAGTGDVLMARLREGRTNTARGAAAHFLRETVGASAPCRVRGATHGAVRQRLLYPRRGRRLPQARCPLLHHHPPARQPAESHRGNTRGGLDAHPLPDGRRRRCGRDHLQSLSQ